ncbi:MAG: FG-GAP-like repeat-containing protein [bacterium]|nr:FG-GAP-like repeat-containing protein [bacterium]
MHKFLFTFLCCTVCLLTWSSTTSAQNGQKLPFAHEILREYMGGLTGAAMFDYDNDGDLDIYVTNGMLQPNRLLQNDGQGNFVDVAATANVGGKAESHGVATADIDNDGDLDIFVANYLQNYLYLNNGDGTFTEIAQSAGITSKYFSSTAAFADIDNDGFVDLYVGGADVVNGKGTGEMYLNNGNLKFTNVTQQTGTASTYSWSVRFCDYDNDGDPDLFTANDQGISKPGEWSPIFLFRNEGNLKFTDLTRFIGLGITGSWMGMAFSDYDNDGDFDFFASNLGNSFILDSQDHDHHGFFQNNGAGTFVNVASNLGLAEWDFGWGAVFTDYNNDGDTDLYYVGNYELLNAFKNPGHLFINNKGTFTEETEKYGMQTVNSSGVPTMAVGVAAGDVNNDGHVDLFVSNAGRIGRPSYPLLFTEKHDNNYWLRLKLEGTHSNRAAIGAKIILTADGKTQVQEIASGSSSFSQNSLWPTFGLGLYPRADKIEIHWPSGIVQTLENVQANQVLEVREVQPPSSIALNMEQLAFEDVEVGQPTQLAFTVSNNGKGPLQITGLSSDLPLQFPSTTFDVPAGETRTITLTLTQTQVGPFSGTLQILSNDPDRGTVTLPLSGTATIIYADPRADFNGDNQLTLSDFLAFARAFNSTDPTYDLNGNNIVDFADFVLFAKSFGRPLP